MSTSVSDRPMSLAEAMAAAPRPRKRRLRRWWFPALAALLALWFLPAVATRTPLVQWAIDRATTSVNGRVTVDSVSLGWFSPIRVHGLSLTDDSDQRLLEVPKAESSRTLLGLLVSRSELGVFRLVGPKLAVALQGGASNIEHVLAEYLEPSDEPAARFDVTLEIVDGSVSVTDLDRRRSWNIEPFTLTVRVPGGGGLLELTAAGMVADPQHPGRFDFALNLPLSESPAVTSEQTPLAELASPPDVSTEVGPAASDIALQFHSEAVPLALLEPVLSRFSPGLRLGGLLSAEVEAVAGSGASAQHRLSVKAATHDFQLAAPALGNDRIDLAHLALEGEAVTQDGKLVVRSSTLQCELGNLTLAGTVDVSEESLRAMPGMLAAQVFELEGSVDLARLAAMLPGTLQLRPEMKVTSGSVQFALHSERGDDGMAWQGQLTSSALKALDGGREIAWEQPVQIVFAMHATHDGPLAGELRCQSDFLKLHAAGTARQFTADATFNLDQLARQLGQFADLGSLTLAGEGWSHFTWKHVPEGAFETEVELHVNRLRVALPGRPPWHEDEVIVLASAAGRTDFGMDTRVEAAKLNVAAASDRIEARLLRPVPDLREGGTWPVAFHMQGELAHWPPRIAMVGDVGDMPIAGRYETAGQLTASRRMVHLAETSLRIDALDLTLPGVRMIEPQAQIDVAGTWDHEAGRLKLEQAALRTTSLAAAADDLTVTAGAGGAWELTGTVACQGHLRGLQQWFIDPANRPAWTIDGRLTGTTRFEHSGGRTHGVVEAEIENLRIAGSEGQPFHDPRVKLSGRGSYDAAGRAVVLDGLTIHSETVALDGQGGADMASDEATVQLTGRLQYDMQQLSALLRPYVGGGVELVGRHASPLSFAGPLDLQRARGTGALAWQQGEIYGFAVGPGELTMRLADGVLAADPLDVAVSQGRVHLAPKVHVAPGPTVLTLEPGPLATQVQITPAMCASALKFIAPVLAGVTTAQGAFSIELDRCRIPIDHPGESDLAGRLTVHSVEVGPGPLIRELAVLLQREAPARLRRESVVPFRMVEGRVHHEDLEMIFPDVTIRTRGSVGVDQSMSLVASMPIPPKWLTTDLLRTAFAGQELQIPIRGTLTAPRLDRAELDRWNRRILEEAAQNVIRDQLDRGLDRLLRPR